ncbi:AmmeMemoRadiSam system protein B [Patescibacteria group bacterium]|nr:AmmeMemoRadiSam system protein B [Patescibacteria group bacterium]
MLVFCAIVPHPPLLIPSIGKENMAKLDKTINAFNILEEDLNQAAPDTIIVISPHGEISFDSFTINTHQNYIARFEKFGDFSTEMKFKADLQFINELKSKTETKLPVQLISDENLDHGASIPLYYLTRKNASRRIVPINYSYQSNQKHIEFGEAIKEAVFSLDKRCAIIASGDLSHRLSMNAPAGFSPKAKEFDKKIIQFLKKKNVDGIMNMESDLVDDAAECGLRSILILLGAIKKMNYEFEVLSYESPFGVGYLVAEAKFK